jgi:CheY-like chemotaxis protein
MALGTQARQWGRSGSGRRATDLARSKVAASSADEPRVLVVDDDPHVCLMHAIYLRTFGCKVFTAPDGFGALEHASALAPDVIVMDLQIPHLDGCEAIRRLNESSSTRGIPVVAVTKDPNMRLRAFEAGCAAYLTKPCAPPIVWAQIRALLRLPESRAVRTAES